MCYPSGLLHSAYLISAAIVNSAASCTTQLLIVKERYGRLIRDSYTEEEDLQEPEHLWLMQESGGQCSSSSPLVHWGTPSHLFNPSVHSMLVVVLLHRTNPSGQAASAQHYGNRVTIFVRNYLKVQCQLLMDSKFTLSKMLGQRGLATHIR